MPDRDRSKEPRASIPAFIIVGAQKAGTTFLFNLLSRHPSLRPAVEKEVRFFSQNVSYQRGEHWYRQFFSPAGEPGRLLLTFEASPDYLYSDVAARRIFEFDPRMKLIVTLRNPTERAYSAWNMYRQIHERPVLPLFPSSRFDERLREDLHRLLHAAVFPSFDEAVRRELANRRDEIIETDFVRVGFYDMQLSRYLEVFSRDQILILTREAMLRDPGSVADTVTDFLGIASFEWPEGELPRSGVADYAERIDADVAARLNEIYRPHNERLAEMIGFDPGWMQ